jgi:hypothetical protein
MSLDREEQEMIDKVTSEIIAEMNKDSFELRTRLAKQEARHNFYSREIKYPDIKDGELFCRYLNSEQAQAFSDELKGQEPKPMVKWKVVEYNEEENSITLRAVDQELNIHPKIKEGIDQAFSDELNADKESRKLEELPPAPRVVRNKHYPLDHHLALKLDQGPDKSKHKVYPVGSVIKSGYYGYVVKSSGLINGELVHYVQDVERKGLKPKIDIDYWESAKPGILKKTEKVRDSLSNCDIVETNDLSRAEFDVAVDTGAVETDFPAFEVGDDFAFNGAQYKVIKVLDGEIKVETLDWRDVLKEPEDSEDPNSEVLFTAFNNSFKNNFPW